jgi:AcrR family transcriptional regulator
MMGWMDDRSELERHLDALYVAVRDGEAVDRQAAFDIAMNELEHFPLDAEARELAEASVAGDDGTRLASAAAAFLDANGYEPGFEQVPERFARLERALDAVRADMRATGLTGEVRLVRPHWTLTQVETWAGDTGWTGGIFFSDAADDLGDVTLMPGLIDPATTLEAVAEAADVPLPTLYRLFGSKRGVLKAVLDTAFGGDDEPVAFRDRPQVRAALAEPDPGKLLDRFARICRELMQRSADIQHVLATAAIVDTEVASLLTEIRRQRHRGQSRIVAALIERGALDPKFRKAEAEDIVYTILSPEVHRILTVERRWSADRYECWLARSFRNLIVTPG